MDARPHQQEMEEAINNFLLRLEKQEKKGFKDRDLASILSQLPKPAQGSVRSISVADAIKAGFLPAMDEDQADMFTPSELHLYRHAKDHRLNRDIPGCPGIYQFLVLGYPGILPPTDIDMLTQPTSICRLGRRRGWTPAELNSILQNHVVRNREGYALTTFGCVEWESELYRGVMRARCYPWNMPKHRFHKMNPQVIPCYPWLYT